MQVPEPLLQNSHNKYTAFPISFPDIWEFYLKHEKTVWKVHEVCLTGDLAHWKKLSSNEQYFVKHVLAFFAASDGIVMENLATRFCAEIQVAEARSFYTTQMYIENVHSIMYGQLIETYISNSIEKEDLFNAVERMPAITQKAEWAKKWIESSERFAVRLVAFAIVEGIFFSGSFCCIYWLKERGVMPGLCLSNDFIARDEGLHTDFAAHLYKNHVKNKLSTEELHSIVSEAVAIEKNFIIDSLPCSLLGMNAATMSDYIDFVADRLIKQLGHKSFYAKVRQPFPFMDRISLQNQINFFDERSSEYQQDVEIISRDLNSMSFDADF